MFDSIFVNSYIFMCSEYDHLNDISTWSVYLHEPIIFEMTEQVCACVCVCVCVCVNACVHACMCVCKCVCMFMGACV